MVKIKNIQIAFFLKELGLDGLQKHKFVIGFFRGVLGEIDNQKFSIEDTFGPLQVPADIPLLSFNSDNYKVGIARGRIDLFRKEIEVDSDQKVAEILQTHKEIGQKISDYLLKQKVGIHRVGFVFITQTDDFKVDGEQISNIPDFLATNFISPKVQIKGFRDIVIRFNRRLINEDMKYNHVIQVGGNEDNLLEKNFDINTVPDQDNNRSFEREKVENILEYSLGKIIELNKQFPNFKLN